MELFIGIDKNNELVCLEWDKENNRQRKTFSLCGSSYNSPINEEQGEEEARNVLSTAEHWDDLGMLESKSFLTDFIDFDKVSDHVINLDGWQNTNGEYQEFGEIEGQTIYLNASSGGQHQVKIKDFKKLFVSEEDLKEVYKLWDNQHLKPLEERHLKVMDLFFEKYKNLCDRQEALNKSFELMKE